MLEALNHARSFAIAAHADQMYGDQPYSFHLDAVVELLAVFGEQAQIIGILHDVVEDTDVSLQTVRHKELNLAGTLGDIWTRNNPTRRWNKAAAYVLESACLRGFETLGDM